MIQEASVLIKASINAAGYACDIIDVEQGSVVVSRFTLNCGREIVVQFISLNNEAEIPVRVMDFITDIPPAKSALAYEACGRLNTAFRCACFVYEGNKINIHAGILGSTGATAGAVAVELLLKTVEAAENAYSKLKSLF